MSKFSINEKVYFTRQSLFAQVVTIIAVKKRVFFSDKYLVDSEYGFEWATENKLEKIEESK